MATITNAFGIKGKLLSADTAKEIYDHCSEMLRTPQFSVCNIICKMNISLLCTTEEPLDTLEHHKKIREDNFETKVYAAFRPDKALAVEDLPALNTTISTKMAVVYQIMVWKLLTLRNTQKAKLKRYLTR
jgi:glucuronate isomerase